MGPERRGRAVHGRVEVNPSGEEPTDRPRQKNAGLWEPYDGRLSRTVLTEREGEVPSRHSPGFGHRLAASTVWQILKNAGIDPAPTRSEVTWSQFLRSQAAVACDFATIDTVTLRRFYLLLCIDIPTRSVYFAGVTDHPTGVWTTQAARNLLLRHGRQLADARALVRDRASQFIDAFDEIFRTEGMKILKTPVRTPVANAFAERWIGTLRRELLATAVAPGLVYLWQALPPFASKHVVPNSLF